MKKLIIAFLLVSSPAFACVKDAKKDFRPISQKFAEWDKNGDGGIDYAEAYTVLNYLSFAQKQNDWKQRLQSDIDKNEKIEINEFLQAFPEVNC